MNRIEFLRKEKGWTQDQLADAVNAFLKRNPDLKKITDKNLDGFTDQKTIQRVEKGIVALNERWLEIFRNIFNVTSSDLLCETSEEEFKILQNYRRASERKREALLSLLE